MYAWGGNCCLWLTGVLNSLVQEGLTGADPVVLIFLEAIPMPCDTYITPATRTKQTKHQIYLQKTWAFPKAPTQGIVINHDRYIYNEMFLK